MREKKARPPLLSILLPVLGLLLLGLAALEMWAAAAALVLLWFFLATGLSLANLLRGLRQRRGGGDERDKEE